MRALKWCGLFLTRFIVDVMVQVCGTAIHGAIDLAGAKTYVRVLSRAAVREIRIYKMKDRYERFKTITKRSNDESHIFPIYTPLIYCVFAN